VSLAIAVVSGKRARRGSRHMQFPTFGRWTRTICVIVISITQTVWVTAVSGFDSNDTGFRSFPLGLRSIFSHPLLFWILCMEFVHFLVGTSLLGSSRTRVEYSSLGSTKRIKLELELDL
jgi:uncharacterized membrane protein YhdT